MLQKAERPSASDAEPSKGIVKRFPAVDVSDNSYSVLQLQVSRLQRRYILSQALAATVARLVYSGRAA